MWFTQIDYCSTSDGRWLKNSVVYPYRILLRSLKILQRSKLHLQRSGKDIFCVYFYRFILCIQLLEFLFYLICFACAGQKKRSRFIIPLAVGLSVFLVLVLVALFVFYRRKKWVCNTSVVYNYITRGFVSQTFANFCVLSWLVKLIIYLCCHYYYSLLM